ncbi:hypothetical protein O181_033128 [Austropuccinia psidii MF-1]|uniref:Uncharacterized protein n=1 Tax=Austropuccinia psidii MF-1 TaxID=1389203 RepID=A0A9Q3D0W1_9BASI|nr:hypothetical protein [Austropuccinia psidii MF-1]
MDLPPWRRLLPKPQVDPPEPILAQNGQRNPRLAIINHGLWKPPGPTSSGPERHPLNSGENLSFIHVPCAKASRRGAYMG